MATSDHASHHDRPTNHRRSVGSSLSEALETAGTQQLDETEAINQIDQKILSRSDKAGDKRSGSYSAQGLAGALTAASIARNTGLSRVPVNLVGGMGNSLGICCSRIIRPIVSALHRVAAWAIMVRRRISAIARVTGDRIKNNRDQAKDHRGAKCKCFAGAYVRGKRPCAARASRVSAEQLAESETRQFGQAQLRSFSSKQRQNELTIARSRELQAQTESNKAISDFLRVIGTTWKSIRSICAEFVLFFGSSYLVVKIIFYH